MNDLIQTQSRTINFFDPTQMEGVQRAAKMFANSDLVPDMYKIGGKLQNPENKAIANCVIAMNMATRMSADVLMIMQNLVIVQGRPSWSSAFLISSVNSSGRFEPMKYRITNKGKLGKVDYVDYEWNGKHKAAVNKTFDGSKIDNIECVAYTKSKGSDEVLESSPISIEMAIKEGWYTKAGSKWQTMPEQMLRYRAASFWTRAYAPEISMGMHTVEEVQDIETIDAEYEVVDKKVEREIQEKANSEVMEMPAQEDAPEPAAKEPIKATPEQAFEAAENIEKVLENDLFPQEEKPKPKF